MIHFSDATINESLGNFDRVREIMYQDNLTKWMLRSDATIIPEHGPSFSYLLHFWQDGSVVIKSTNHPPMLGSPDDDLRELKEWCGRNGWHQLRIDNNLVQEPVSFEYWMQKYRAGFIDCEELRQHDDAEMQRMMDILEEEKEEEISDAY